MKKLLFIIILFFSFNLFSQTENYNTKTLNLFNQGNWDELITLGEKAIDKNQSSYEIEYRLAVAYYNKKKYFDSAKHFENLNKKYQVSNDYILEYLYYAYLFSGRTADALLVAKKFPFHLKEKINVKNIEIVDYIYAEGGVKLSSRSKIDIDNMTYLNGGIGQKLGYHLNLNHSFTFLSQKYLDFDYNQKEYYINTPIQISKGLSVIPAYHFINIAENNLNNNHSNNINPGGVFNENIHIVHLALKKQWNRFFIMPNITFSSASQLSDIPNRNTQFGVDLGYTVSGLSDKLWIGFGSFILNNTDESRFIWNAKANYLITPKMYLFLKYLNANTSNFSEDNAMYYYNSVSNLVDKFSATFGYYISPKFSTFINYQFENAEDVENDFLFTYNTLIAGFKFDF